MGTKTPGNAEPPDPAANANQTFERQAEQAENKAGPSGNDGGQCTSATCSMAPGDNPTPNNPGGPPGSGDSFEEKKPELPAANGFERGMLSVMPTTADELNPVNAAVALVEDIEDSESVMEGLSKIFNMLAFGLPFAARDMEEACSSGGDGCEEAAGKAAATALLGAAAASAGNLTKKGKAPRKKRVVNKNMGHAAERAVECAGFKNKKSATATLKEFGKQIENDGLPSGTVQDTHYSDRVIVPGFGDGGAVVYKQKANGSLQLRTVVEFKSP